MTDGPFLVVDVGGYEPVPAAIFTTREKAEAFIAIYEEAITNAQSRGVNGVCRSGALEIEEHLEVDPEHPRILFDGNLYINRYWTR